MCHRQSEQSKAAVTMKMIMVVVVVVVVVVEIKEIVVVVTGADYTQDSGSAWGLEWKSRCPSTARGS